MRRVVRGRRVRDEAQQRHRDRRGRRRRRHCVVILLEEGVRVGGQLLFTPRAARLLRRGGNRDALREQSDARVVDDGKGGAQDEEQHLLRATCLDRDVTNLRTKIGKLF